MANRKQQNLEIERQVKNRNLIFRIVSLTIALVIVVSIGIGIWIVQDRRWIMRYDGGRVAAADFRALHDLQFEGNPAAREAAMTSLQGIVVLRDRAIRHEVDFTPEEREEAESQMQSWRNELQWNFGWDIVGYISNARMAEIFNTTNQFERLTDIYVPTYDVDEEEFSEIWETYIEANLHNHMDLQVHFIALESWEEIEEVEAQLGEVPFEELMREYITWMDEDFEIEPEPLTGDLGWLPSLQQMALSEEDQEFLLNMEAGEYSHIITLWNMEIGEPLFVIFNMVSRNDEVDLEEVEAGFRVDFIDVRRRDLFHDLVLEWVEEANFVVNQRGYNTTI